MPGALRLGRVFELRLQIVPCRQTHPPRYERIEAGCFRAAIIFISPPKSGHSATSHFAALALLPLMAKGNPCRVRSPVGNSSPSLPLHSVTPAFHTLDMSIGS